MMMRLSMALFVSLILVCECGHAFEDWTQFLGPEGSSEASNGAPLVKWDQSDYRWATDIPGTGWSSPVYADGKIWITSSEVTPATEQQLAERLKGVQFANMKTAAGAVDFRACCIDLESGAVVHNVSLAKVTEPDLINPLNSYASPTAAIANGKVVCHFGAYGTWCLDASSAQTIWQTKYVVDHSVGPGSSPVVVDDKVLIVCDGIDDQFVAAVKLSDGSEVWKTARPSMRADNGEFQKAYSTPLIVEVAGKKQAVVPGAQWIVAYDPIDGQEIWRVDHGSGFSVTPMASFENGLVMFSTGFMRPEVIAVDPTGAGDVTKSHVKWRVKNGPSMPSMVSVNDHIFFISDKGILNCVNVNSGELVSRKRVGGNFSASPLLAGGNLYLPSREGKVTVVKADPSLEVVATNSFDSQQLMATPAPFGNDLIFRVGDKLYRIGKKAG